jgi:alkanesulfonate monooxygenase SsuD/methylene tetrahydromethanopterin reductase-like flavin-dependent oxidoreductase (luciferase family)
VRLAEEIAFVDLLSGGRLSPVFGAGYRPEEFEAFGVSLASRRRRVLEAIDVCRKAWTGEPFEFEGRKVTVTPRPVQVPGPPIIYGGTTEATARRAAHVADGFDPGDPQVWDYYRDECKKLGADPGPWIPRGPTYVFVTDDPDRIWNIVGPNLLHATNSYAQWIAASRQAGNVWYPAIASVEELRSAGQYQVVTPDECVEIAEGLGRDGHLIFRPLFGGTEPELAWESLSLFESHVLPRLTVPSDT